ncbi:membrane protease YdiL (CAAX protease family) [Bacillus ectoiniformans]|uniref:CPBP family intramembrane glutamic endopeptidase n=1 Tax=Bacillus ectoiniformans TaxID=1494429 RepID=UPI00195711C7|nr:CPBP family intramembrane glutamic endopeptidase [Bacillus ectoiniformans]MBM7648562.1 membrane protease YdiL (CAAX protease family) [Bacillus ectoiniformans]
MDTYYLVWLIILAVGLEAFLIFLMVKYKKGDIDENPFFTMIQKEWKVIYYAFFRWRTAHHDQDGQSFSLHKQSNYYWLFLALMHEQVIEMVVFHIYLKAEAPSMAYILTALHIYSILYILGDYNWLRNTPVKVKNNLVEMKIGSRREFHFHIKDIQSIQKAAIQYDQKGGMIHEKGVFHVTAFPRLLTHIFGMGDELKYEIIFTSPRISKSYFGIKKEVNKAFLYIKESDQLAELLEQKMDQYVDEVSEVQSAEPAEVISKQPLIHWKLYFTILGINAAGAMAIVPYALARGNFHQEMGVSKTEFFFIFTGQMIVESAILIFLAMLMAKKVHVKTPILDTVVSKNKLDAIYMKKMLAAAGYGVLAALLIILISLTISKPLGIDNSSISEPVWWLGIMGSFGAAATEETIFRFFLITFVLWIVTKLRKRSHIQTSDYWVAIIFASLIFAGLHYGIASATYEMTIGLFLGMLLINGTGGIVFGLLFLKSGIEFAMIAHFMADIVIHVIAPLFIS